MHMPSWLYRKPHPPTFTPVWADGSDLSQMRPDGAVQSKTINAWLDAKGVLPHPTIRWYFIQDSLGQSPSSVQLDNLTYNFGNAAMMLGMLGATTTIASGWVAYDVSQPERVAITDALTFLGKGPGTEGTWAKDLPAVVREWDSENYIPYPAY